MPPSPDRSLFDRPRWTERDARDVLLLYAARASLQACSLPSTGLILSGCISGDAGSAEPSLPLSRS